jgi:hypothetical protein
MEGSDTALPICRHFYECTHIYVVRPHISLARRGSESRSSRLSAGSGKTFAGGYRTFRECGAGFGPCPSVNYNYNYDMPVLIGVLSAAVDVCLLQWIHSQAQQHLVVSEYGHHLLN